MPQLHLLYNFTPSPYPVRASAGGANPNTVDLQVTINPPGIGTVTLREILVQIPVGAEIAGDLSDAANLPTPTGITGADGWTVSSAGSVVRLQGAQGGTPVAGPISFTLARIAVNQTSGTVPITITEFPPSGPKVIDGTTYSIFKQPADFPITSFTAVPAQVYDPDQQVTLYWTCSSQGAAYDYSLSSDQGWSPVNCLQGGSCYSCGDGAGGVTTPPVQQTTTFTLEAIRTINGQRQVAATLATTVEMTVPYFSPDFYLAQSSLGTGRLARLHWLAFNAGHCQVSLDGKVLDAGAPTDVVENGYPVLVPPDGASHVFSVVAYPAQGTSRATLTFPPATALATAPAVSLGGGTAGSVAVTPDGKLALVCNPDSNLVTVIELETGTAEPGGIAVGKRPYGIAITPDAALALVATISESALWVVDIAARTAAGTIPLPAWPTSVTLTPGGQLALVTTNAGQMLVVNVPGRKVQGSPISVCPNPFAAAITPDGTLAFVTCFGSSVTVIGMGTLTPEPQPIHVDGMAAGIAVTPDGTLALVATFNRNAVAVIDVAGRKAEPQPIPVAGLPSYIAVTPDGKYALVSNSNGTVAVIDIAKRAVVDPPEQVGTGAAGIAVTPGGLLALASNFYDGTVSLV